MLGYVTIEKGELKVREYEIYNGYYCGICKSIGRRIGQIGRMFLSFDSVFLAMILSSVNEEKEVLKHEHCIVHHLERKPVISENKEIDYAADVMMILAYEKTRDDLHDDRAMKAFAGKTVLEPSYRKVRRGHQNVCNKVREGLEKLSRLEEEKSPSIDLGVDAFAQVMEALFTGYFKEAGLNRILANLGGNLGKWIYLIDALDDLDEDIESNNYNPLRYRYAGKKACQVAGEVEPLLYFYLSEVGNALDLLDIKKNKGIIDNIIFMGLRRRTEMILDKASGEERKMIDEQSI